MSASTASKKPASPFPAWQPGLILFLASVASVGAYLLYSALSYRLGFPLDDSWIHQTYARNLALLGEWSYWPGQVSGGSTAPLWTVFLALGYLLRLSPYLWTFTAGILLLFGLSLAVETSLRRRLPGYGIRLPWAGLLIVLEWHLVWAAASGMETLLHALLVFLVIDALWKKSANWLWLGILVGISLWTRPDGVTLLGPLFFCLLFGLEGWKSRARAVLLAGLGFGLVLLPYLVFNYRQAGSLLPTTFYAKQAEYAAWQATPLAGRLLEGFLQINTGAGLLLLPGVLIGLVGALRRREWGLLAGLLWCGGYLLLYMLRLPAYQHGRYLMPLMPVYLFAGLYGYFQFQMKTTRETAKKWWFLRTGWGLGLLATTLTFWLAGMDAYNKDVRFIESEMVATGRWVAANLPDQALIGAHDIGALGYFGGHELVDMAGLISPDLIPILREEQALAGRLDEFGVAYLVVFPDWYPELTRGRVPIYSTGAPYGPAMGETNMTVYRWPLP